MHSHLINQSEALNFITAGNATFTFKSLKTGKRFTYKAVAKEKYGVNRLYINYLRGSDNILDYGYLCTIEKNDSGLPLITFVSSRLKESPVFSAFRFVWMALLGEIDMPQLEIWHEGRCCRCGRTLTVPESIERGIGPECFDKVNKFAV